MGIRTGAGGQSPAWDQMYPELPLEDSVLSALGPKHKTLVCAERLALPSGVQGTRSLC